MKAKIIIRKQPAKYNNDHCLQEQLTTTTLKNISSQGNKCSGSDTCSLLLKNIENTIKQSLNSFNELYNRSKLQLRDQKVDFLLPEVSNDLSIYKKRVQIWLTKVCGSIFSIAFQQQLNNSLTYQQCKIFCSQNILRNLALLAQNQPITPQIFELIDKHIKYGVLKYMTKKYPLTESSDINKLLNVMVREIDNYKNLEYDFFNSSSIVFQLRESANYNDLIMKVINQKIKEIDEIQPSGDIEDLMLSNYKIFEGYFMNLFQKVEDEEWMNQKDKEDGLKTSQSLDDSKRKRGSVELFDLFGKVGTFYAEDVEKKKLTKKQQEQIKQKQKKKIIQKQKYKQKVKQYTNYLIGRKISENVNAYNDKEINSLHLVIKNPSILRTLTKWCQQLWQKFQTKNYFRTNHEQGIKVQRGGNINILPLHLKQSLDKQMQDQRIKIEQFMEEVRKNNYEMQASLMMKELIDDKDITYIQHIQMACGLFSAKVVNNLHNYITTFLNRLIHGLLNVSNKWFINNRSALKAQMWPSPPNLVTLKIGDMMRCKCESHQHEILNIYKHIQKVSRQNPDQLKIIRVKNRLKKSTNDVLINVRLFNKNICEIQLAVHSKKSQFIKQSNKFSHFLYQLQRSTFGPITQLCSIWSALDQRSILFQQLLTHSNSDPIDGIHGCEQGNNKASMKIFERPFICSQCKVAYSHNNFIRKHLKCQNCAFWRCGKCQIQIESSSSLLQNIILNPKIRQNCKKIDKNITELSKLPEYGLCILMQSKIPKLQYFRFLNVKGKYYLFGSKDNKIYQIFELNSPSNLKQFMKHYVIFQLSKQLGESLIDVNAERANHQYLLIKYVKDIYKKQKNTINLQQQNLTDQKCYKILQGEYRQKESVKNIDLQANQLTNIKYISEQFPNLISLQLNQNKIDNLEGLDRLFQLQKLYVGGSACQNKTIPEQICHLHNLQILDLHAADIQIIPQSFSNLKQLRKLELGNNRITQFSQSICQLPRLQHLILYSNKLKALPQSIGDMRSLQNLILSNNQLQEIPERVSLLENLIKIDFRGNKLKSINCTFRNLINLQEVDFSGNSLQEIPEDLGVIQSIKTLNLNHNKLSRLPSKIHWKQLTTINISQNLINNLPTSFYNCLNLLKIEASNNSIYQIDDKIGNLLQLHTLNLSHNNLQYIPLGLSKLQNLIFLSLNYNKIKKFPQQIGKLQKLQYLYMAGNKIQEIPDDIQGCISLKEFYLNQNQIKHIEVHFNKLVNIEDGHLDLSDNPIESIKCLEFVLAKADYATAKRAKQISNIPIQNQQAEIVNVKNFVTSHRRSRNSKRSEVVQRKERHSISHSRDIQESCQQTDEGQLIISP